MSVVLSEGLTKRFGKLTAVEDLSFLRVSKSGSLDGGGGGADNSCSPPRQLRKQPDGPSLTIPGAVTGFEGFEGAGHRDSRYASPLG